jgi:hypothetical protein
MGRCTVMRWAFVAGLLCFCGCTGPRTFSPFGWMHGSDSTPASSSTDKSNPLKPADQVASDDDSSATKADGSKSDDAAAADGKPGKNGFKTAAIDPDLRKLMDEELAYEPKEERQRLFNQWSKFDPAFIRELVENHRMARETADNRQHPVKLASADSVQDREGQAADLDLSTPPKSSNRPSAPSEPTAPSQTPPSQTPPPASGAVSPWSDPGDMPALPTNPPASTAAPSTPGTGTAVAGAAGSGPNSADAFDSPGAGPGQPGRPISILPMTPPPGTARNNFPKNDPIPPSSATAETPNAAPSPPKADPFAGMTPLYDGTPAAPSPAAPAAVPAPVATPAPTPATTAAPAAPAANSAATTSDGLLIQPGVAAPASVISSLHPQAKEAPAGPASSDFDAVPTASSLDAPAPMRSAGSPPNSANPVDSTQPVQLQLPTDVPSSSAVASADAVGSKSTAVAEVSPPAASGSASTPSSGLAGLGNRLFGAISPNLSTAAKNAIQNANWHDELQKIVTVAATEAGQTSVGTTDAEKLKYVEKQVHLRMLYLLAGQPAKSLEPISGLDAPDQEFWQQVFWGVSNYFDKTAMADPSDRATQTVTQLRTAVHRLQEKSKLELRNVAFCQKIVNYGNYERVKRDEFNAGQLVLLYAEVENFKSEATTDGPYRTILKSTIEIFDSHGQSVQSMPFPPTDDLCANPRRDYYNSYEFAIPQRIGLGPHSLKLTVEDQISRKVATYTMNFTVK